MKKMVSVVLLICMLFCSVSFAEQDDSAAMENALVSLEADTLPVYLEVNGTEPFNQAFPVFYVNEVEDLPYVDIRDAVNFINSMITMDNPENPQYLIECNEESEMTEIHLDGNESFLWMDFGDQTVTYTNYNTFGNPGSGILMDALASSGFDAETGEAELFQRNPNAVIQRNGTPLTIHMGDYNISMIHQNTLFLMPLHTVFILLLDMPNEGGVITCVSPNGIFIGSGEMFGYLDAGLLSDLGELYYKGTAGERSAQLAGYGLNELCMEMDHFYGLKEVHGISSFMELVINSGLFETILSPNGAEADAALAGLLNYYLDDGHTGYNGNSPWTGADPEYNPLTEIGSGFSTSSNYDVRTAFENAQKVYPDAKKPYLEVGNTAFIYQEQFKMGKNPAEYYTDEISEEEIAEDTVALIIYAHRQITRENSPIENVVIDLSCNGGGQADAAVFMLCWFLGDAPFSITSPATGAQSTALYRADVNLDRHFDEKDELAGKNLYCLTSPLSFSCGNLVPWIFKSSGKVTLLGDTTGGGSCVVLPMSSAWGSLFQTSGTSRISFVKNGSYYDVDRGVDPDVFLTKVSTFCDREKLTEIINNLY